MSFKAAPGWQMRFLSLLFFLLAGRAVTYAQPRSWFDAMAIGITLYWAVKLLVDDAVERRQS